MMLFVVAWLIIGYVVGLQTNFWQFLSYWGEALLAIYFIFAFGVALHGIIERPKEGKTEKSNGGELKQFCYKLVSSSETQRNREIHVFFISI